MSSLFIDDTGRTVPVAKLSGVSFDVLVGGTSTASGAGFSARCTLVRLCATADCRIAFGDAPVATTSSALLPAGASEVFAVQPGWKVATVQLASAGVLNVAEIL